MLAILMYEHKRSRAERGTERLITSYFPHAIGVCRGWTSPPFSLNCYHTDAITVCLSLPCCALALYVKTDSNRHLHHDIINIFPTKLRHSLSKLTHSNSMLCGSRDLWAYIGLRSRDRRSNNYQSSNTH